MVNYETRLLLNRLTPPWLGRTFYYFVLNALRLGLSLRMAASGEFRLRQLFGEQRIVKIWARNSILTDSFSPFLSDLDITIFFSNSSTEAQIALVLNYLKSFSGIFKIVHECNSYTPGDCVRFIDCLNPVEARRDPRLCQVVLRDSGRNQTVAAAHKLAYIFRHLESNMVALTERPELQIKKWRLHLGACGLEMPSTLNLPALVDHVLEQLLVEPHRPTYFEDLMEYFRERMSGVPHHRLTLSPAAAAFYPNSLCLYDLSQIAISEELRQIQRAQIQWETWGLMSQWRQYRWRGPTDQMSFRNHAANLKKSFGDIDCLEKLSQLV